MSIANHRYIPIDSGSLSLIDWANWVCFSLSISGSYLYPEPSDVIYCPRRVAIFTTTDEIAQVFISTMRQTLENIYSMANIKIVTSSVDNTNYDYTAPSVIYIGKTDTLRRLIPEKTILTCIVTSGVEATVAEADMACRTFSPLFETTVFVRYSALDLVRREIAKTKLNESGLKTSPENLARVIVNLRIQRSNLPTQVKSSDGSFSPQSTRAANDFRSDPSYFAHISNTEPTRPLNQVLVAPAPAARYLGLSSLARFFL